MSYDNTIRLSNINNLHVVEKDILVDDKHTSIDILVQTERSNSILVRDCYKEIYKKMNKIIRDDESKLALQNVF